MHEIQEFFSKGEVAEKFKNLLRPFLRTRSYHVFQLTSNPSGDPVPLNLQYQNLAAISLFSSILTYMPQALSM
jgi:hypothetical protein